jgi:hypothetical protein
MSILSDINALFTAVPVHTGYAPTGSKLPYVVNRPLVVDQLEEAVSGDSLGVDFQTSLYCCGDSVEASFNLALAVAGTLQGSRVGGTTLSASIGYSGAPVEGHYESQVTVQLNQGGI